MKFFDSKYRLFRVINVIDVVVILAVLAGGYAIYRVLSPKGVGGKGGGVSATFDVICPNTRNVTPDQIKIGDAIYKTSGQQIGTISAVKFTPTPVEAYDFAAHHDVLFASQVATDIVISVKTTGSPTSTGFAVGSTMIHGNVPMPVMTSTFDCDTAYLSNLKISGQ